MKMFNNHFCAAVVVRAVSSGDDQGAMYLLLIIQYSHKHTYAFFVDAN